MLNELRQIASDLITENPWWQYRRDRYSLPDGGEGDYHYVHTRGSVMIVPVTDSGSIVLTRQYRYLNRRESLEFAGGGIQLCTTAEQSARNELREETGYSCDRLDLIGSFNPMNGVTDELCSVFIARGLKPAPAAPDTTEEFECVELAPDALQAAIADGTIWDGMTLASCAMIVTRKIF